MPGRYGPCNPARLIETRHKSRVDALYIRHARFFRRTFPTDRETIPMKRLMLALLLWPVQGALAQMPKTDYWCPEKSCKANEYLVFSKPQAGPTSTVPDPGCSVGCVPSHLPPSAGGHVYIECTRTSTFTHTCNAWVKGPQLQFYWSPDGPFAMYQTGSSQGDQVELVCWHGDVGAGTVSVSIASPFGMHSSATLDIDCGQNNL